VDALDLVDIGPDLTGHRLGFTFGPLCAMNWTTPGKDACKLYLAAHDLHR
jgi:hypothetical protein